MKTFTLLAGAALLAGAGVALAQGGPGADRHGPDGDVTRQQAIAHVDEMFARLDANRDGNISREEFAEAHAGHDGPEGHGPGMEMGPPPPGGPDGPGGRMHGMRGMGGMRAMFGDQGFVTLEQMRAHALARFDRADANHDGILTADERQAAHGRMRDGQDEPRQN